MVVAIGLLRPPFSAALPLAEAWAPGRSPFEDGPADWEEALLHAQTLADRRAEGGTFDFGASARDMVLRVLSYLGTDGPPEDLVERLGSGFDAHWIVAAREGRPIPDPILRVKDWCDVVFRLLIQFGTNLDRAH